MSCGRSGSATRSATSRGWSITEALRGLAPPSNVTCRPDAAARRHVGHGRNPGCRDVGTCPVGGPGVNGTRPVRWWKAIGRQRKEGSSNRPPHPPPSRGHPRYRRCPHGTHTPQASMPPSPGMTRCGSKSRLTEDERAIRDAAHAVLPGKAVPARDEANRHEKFDREIMNEMGEMGFLGATLEGYGCAGVNYVSYGLIAREVERVDSGYRSAFSVQSSLVMYPIQDFGTEAQKEKYPAEAAQRRIGRLLRPDRAGCRLGPRLDAHARKEGRRRLSCSTARRPGSPTRRSPTYSWCGRRTMPATSAASSWSEGMKGLSAPKIEGKFSPAGLGHRHDHDGGRLRPRREPAAQREGRCAARSPA